MRDILIIGLIIAVTIILVRVIIGTPMIRRVMETFAVGPTVINLKTECPRGSNMYMYDGTAYCCSARINPDANSLAGSCAVPLQRSSESAGNVFCSLGANKDGVRNCYDIPAMDHGCPPDKQKYIPGSPDRCCSNSIDSTCLANPSLTCQFAKNGNLFTTRAQPSCEFLRAQADDGVCPTDYSRMVFDITQGEYQGLSIYGCINMSKGGCALSSTVKRLKDLGYNVDSIPICPVSPK